MGELLPSAVTPDEVVLLGSSLNAAPEYLRALLRSSYRQELLLTEIRDRFPLPVAEPAPKPTTKPTTKPAKGSAS